MSNTNKYRVNISTTLMFGIEQNITSNDVRVLTLQILTFLISKSKLNGKTLDYIHYSNI